MVSPFPVWWQLVYAETIYHDTAPTATAELHKVSAKNSANRYVEAAPQFLHGHELQC